MWWWAVLTDNGDLLAYGVGRDEKDALTQMVECAEYAAMNELVAPNEESLDDPDTQKQMANDAAWLCEFLTSLCRGRSSVPSLVQDRSEYVGADGERYLLRRVVVGR